MYWNRSIPDLPNFKMVSWDDQETILSADAYIQENIITQKRKKLKKYYQFILDSKKPFIVIENGVFRKNTPKALHPDAYHRYSWTSYFQDEGDYNNQNSPSDRWERIQREQNIEIKDWRLDGDYILLILQRPGDSSLKNLLEKHGNYETFLKNVISDIRKYSNRKIRVRLHPQRQDQQLEIIKRSLISGIEISTTTVTNLYEDLKNARVVVGFNSNALTESVCEGVPTFSLCPSSMAWDCSNTNLAELENPIVEINRDQWLNNLGYCQWKKEEILRGDPWFHLIGGSVEK
jgi:hypothetical protein